MKKLLFIAIMLYSHQMLFAQTTIDSVDIRICYDVRMSYYKKRKKQMDEHRLDIGKNGISRYYSYWKCLDQELKDSVHAAGGNYDDYNRIKREKGYPNSKFAYTIFKNYQKALPPILMENSYSPRRWDNNGIWLATLYIRCWTTPVVRQLQDFTVANGLHTMLLISPFPKVPGSYADSQA